jgi:hypothetical protein
VVVRIFPFRRAQPLVYPVAPAPRTAVLVPGFVPCGAIRVFRQGWSEEAMRFEPEAVAGRLLQLEALAKTRIPSLRHAVIVIRRRRDPWLSDADHQRLWDAFRVPVFEQIIRGDSELLATECEAHDGLHVESPALAAGQDSLDVSPCACGRKTPRLAAVGRIELVRSVAAYAR